MKGIMVVWAAAMALAMENISITLRVKAREVSFTRVIISLVTEGRIRLITCGRMMRKKVCPLPYPRILAASYCPWGMDCMPLRYISAK